jgi:hypothetical protein
MTFLKEDPEVRDVGGISAAGPQQPRSESSFAAALLSCMLIGSCRKSHFTHKSSILHIL